jgi:hypothetical protein
MPNPVAPRSRAWDYGLSLAGIAGSNSAVSESRVLSNRDLCVGLITRPEEPYQVCCV